MLLVAAGLLDVLLVGGLLVAGVGFAVQLRAAADEVQPDRAGRVAGRIAVAVVSHLTPA